MRVLQIIPTSGPGGAESVVASLAKALTDMGHEATVASSGRRPDLFRKLKDLGVDALQLRSEGIRQTVCEIAATIRQVRPDVVQAHMFDSNIPAAAAALFCRVPVVLTVHSTVYEMESAKRRVAYAVLGRLASAVVAVSDSVAEMLVEAGVPKARVTRIHNGVEVSRFADVDRNALRRELGLDGSAKLVGMVANVRPAKDHALLIEAAGEAIKRVSELHLVFAGDGAVPRSAEFEEPIRRTGLDGRIHMLGLREDIPQILGSLDVFVLASKIEGLPVSIIEAMAAGLPVAASDVGGVHEVVEHGKTGILVPPGDPKALAQRIYQITSDPELAAKLGSAARARAVQEFSTEAMAQAHLELYQRCIRRRKGVRR